MTRHSILEYAAALRPRYLTASRSEKSAILSEFCQLTGYHRKAAIRLLRRTPTPPAAHRRGRPRQYALTLVPILVQIWEASDRLCSKRLAPFLPDLVAALERHGELILTDDVRCQLLKLSPATIDRMLAPVRSARGRLPLTQSSASAALKALVPIRTFGEWRGVQPGSLQADLVFHCGEQTGGFHLTTLVTIDVATGWAECQAVWGKGQQRVGSAVHQVRANLPLPLRELHTDNGGEFLNGVLYPWCHREGIALTRGRPYKKNDQAYVEQRNWQIVRRLIGYDRYSTKAAHAQLRALYSLLRLYLNFFQPLRKVIATERAGVKVRKRYDRAQTPYQRLVASGVVSAEGQRVLAEVYQQLNPVALKAEINASLETLWTMADR